MNKREVIIGFLLIVLTGIYLAFGLEEIFRAIQFAMFTVLLLCIFWREINVALGYEKN